MLARNASLFDPPRIVAANDDVKPWKPVPLSHEQWPPDYRAVYAWRLRTLAELRANPEMLRSAKAYYRTHKAEFIMHWMDTYNPRKQGTKWVPFVFFERQYAFIQFLEALDRDQENGIVVKCRDIGATWLACAYSISCFLLDGDDATGWGSRKQELVDKLGDPDSIFEKMRLLLKRLPDVFKPADATATFMKLTNPENGATVTGESGDNIGRGGRKSRYFKDESAHYERPEKIEAALGDNTNVQIDISSVNGLGNVFHRRDEGAIEWSIGAEIPKGYVRRFTFDWRDHPEKDQAWYDARKAKAEREGMQHVFAQEVDRNYAAALQNTIIDYAWIDAAVDAHLYIPCLRQPPPNVWMAGLDVADEGMDRNALALRQWVILRSVEEWGERDPGVTARRAMSSVQHIKGIQVQYDCIGVGSNVKSEYNRLLDEGELSRASLQMVPWNAGAAVVDPYAHVIPDDTESPLNRDFFGNMKAQAWWSIRARFYKTWRCIDALRNGTPMPVYSPEELISLDSAMPLLHQLKKELAQPTRGQSAGLKTIVDKKPNGTKSPNLADAVIQAYFPAPDNGNEAFTGGYSG
jgi:phage terminase large subunit